MVDTHLYDDGNHYSFITKGRLSLAALINYKSMTNMTTRSALVPRTMNILVFTDSLQAVKDYASNSFSS